MAARLVEGPVSARTWRFSDLVVGHDGSLSLTKMQAALFHAALFVTVCFVTWRKNDFVEGMWTLYAAVAVGHAVLDKSGSQIAAYKSQQLTQAVGGPLAQATQEATAGAPGGRAAT